MRLGIKPLPFFGRLLFFFVLTYVVWKPIAPSYTHLLGALTQGFLHIVESSSDPDLHRVTNLRVEGTAIFFQHRLFPQVPTPGIPAEWVQANLVLLIPLMLATPAPTWRSKAWRFGLALALALALQVLDLTLTVKAFYARHLGTYSAYYYSNTSRWLYGFADAFTQAFDTQLFPFAIWAGIHFRELLGGRLRAAPVAAGPKAPHPPRRHRKAAQRRGQRGGAGAHDAASDRPGFGLPAADDGAADGNGAAVRRVCPQIELDDEPDTGRECHRAGQGDTYFPGAGLVCYDDGVAGRGGAAHASRGQARRVVAEVHFEAEVAPLCRYRDGDGDDAAAGGRSPHAAAVQRDGSGRGDGSGVAGIPVAGAVAVYEAEEVLAGGRRRQRVVGNGTGAAGCTSEARCEYGLVGDRIGNGYKRPLCSARVGGRKAGQEPDDVLQDERGVERADRAIAASIAGDRLHCRELTGADGGLQHVSRVQGGDGAVDGTRPVGPELPVARLQVVESELTGRIRRRRERRRSGEREGGTGDGHGPGVVRDRAAEL